MPENREPTGGGRGTNRNPRTGQVHIHGQAVNNKSKQRTKIKKEIKQAFINGSAPTTPSQLLNFLEEKGIEPGTYDVTDVYEGFVLSTLSREVEPEGVSIGLYADNRELSDSSIIEGADLHAVTISPHIDLSYRDLGNINFMNAKLVAVNFEGSYLGDANFGDADLGTANLSKSQIAWGKFKTASLVEANITDSNLRRADLRRANLSSVKLDGAILWQTNLRGANFSDTDLTPSQIAGASICRHTQLPFDGIPIRDGNPIFNFETCRCDI